MLRCKLKQLGDAEALVLRSVEVLDLGRLERPLLFVEDRLHPVDVDALVGWQVVPSVDGEQAKAKQCEDVVANLLVDLPLAPVFGGQRLSGDRA